jgi:hypothetical protein
MKLKGLHFADVAEIQEAVTDELKKVQKEEFSAALQELYDRANACIYANGAYLNIKKKIVSSSCVFDLKKKISPKSFGLHCVYTHTHTHNIFIFAVSVHTGHELLSSLWHFILNRIFQQ